MQVDRIEVSLTAIEKISARKLVAGGPGPVQFDQTERPTFVVRDWAEALHLHLTYSSIGAGAQLRALRIETIDGSKPSREDIYRIMRKAPSYMALVEALLDDRPDEVAELKKRLARDGRRVNNRLDDDDFLRRIAAEYAELRAAGETALLKTLAARHDRSEAMVSRWLKAARKRFGGE